MDLLYYERLELVCLYLQDTLSVEPTVRQYAKRVLKSTEDQPLYPRVLIEIISQVHFDLEIRVASATALKNYVERHWAPPSDGNASAPIDVPLRGHIKSMLLWWLLRAPTELQEQIINVIVKIGKHDFPSNWPDLKVALQQEFDEDNLYNQNVVLKLTHKLVRRFQSEIDSEEAQTIMQTIAVPYAEKLKFIIRLVEKHNNNWDALEVICSSQLLLNQIFYSFGLNNMTEWLGEIWKDALLEQLVDDVLRFLLGTQIRDVDEDSAKMLRQLRSHIYVNICLYATKVNGEEVVTHMKELIALSWEHVFKPHLPDSNNLFAANAPDLLSFGLETDYLNGLLADPKAFANFCKYVPMFLQTFALESIASIENCVLSDFFWPLFAKLLEPSLWDHCNYKPNLLRMLQIFIKRGTAKIQDLGKLPDILNIVKKLIASEEHDQLGFELIESLLMYYPMEKLRPQLSQIFKQLFERISLLRTPSCIKRFVVFFCTCATVLGSSSLVQLIDEIQPGIFGMIIEGVLLTDMNSVTKPLEREQVGVGVTKLLTQCPEIMMPNYRHYWPKLLHALIELCEEVVDASIDDHEVLYSLSELCNMKNFVSHSLINFTDILLVWDQVDVHCRNVLRQYMNEYIDVN